MSKVEDFLSQKEESEVIEAIRIAEGDTSGEIRVHLEKSSQKDPFQRANELFHLLKMDNTRNGNGVLFYVAVADHSLVILGDQGIDKVVPHDFWESTKDLVLGHFKNGNIKLGLVEGIISAGKQLKQHFPYESGDTNELSNEISV